MKSAWRIRDDLKDSYEANELSLEDIKDWYTDAVASILELELGPVKEIKQIMKLRKMVEKWRWAASKKAMLKIEEQLILDWRNKDK